MKEGKYECCLTRGYITAGKLTAALICPTLFRFFSADDVQHSLCAFTVAAWEIPLLGEIPLILYNV